MGNSLNFSIPFDNQNWDAGFIPGWVVWMGAWMGLILMLHCKLFFLTISKRKLFIFCLQRKIFKDTPFLLPFSEKDLKIKFKNGYRWGKIVLFSYFTHNLLFLLLKTRVRKVKRATIWDSSWSGVLTHMSCIDGFGLKWFSLFCSLGK